MLSSGRFGYLFLIDDPATWVEYQGSVAMQRRLGARVELLTPEQAAGGTFPGPAFTEGDLALAQAVVYLAHAPKSAARERLWRVRLAWCTAEAEAH